MPIDLRNARPVMDARTAVARAIEALKPGEAVTIRELSATTGYSFKATSIATESWKWRLFVRDPKTGRRAAAFCTKATYDRFVQKG